MATGIHERRESMERTLPGRPTVPAAARGSSALPVHALNGFGVSSPASFSGFPCNPRDCLPVASAQALPPLARRTDHVSTAALPPLFLPPTPRPTARLLPPARPLSPTLPPAS